jgi:hypothetical protein
MHEELYYSVQQTMYCGISINLLQKSYLGVINFGPPIIHTNKKKYECLKFTMTTTNLSVVGSGPIWAPVEVQSRRLIVSLSHGM